MQGPDEITSLTPTPTVEMSETAKHSSLVDMGTFIKRSHPNSDYINLSPEEVAYRTIAVHPEAAALVQEQPDPTILGRFKQGLEKRNVAVSTSSSLAGDFAEVAGPGAAGLGITGETLKKIRDLLPIKYRVGLGSDGPITITLNPAQKKIEAKTKKSKE